MRDLRMLDKLVIILQCCNVAMLQKFRNFRRIKEVKQNSGALEAYI